MPLDTVGIGLTSRIVFGYEDTPRVKPPFPELSEAQISLADMLIRDLTAISVIEGQFFLAPDAKEYYTEWYTERIKEPNVSGDPRLAGYYERKPMHLLKLAMIVSASKKDETIITLEDLQQAMKMFNDIEVRMPKVFASVGKNPLFADREEVLQAICNSGGMTIGQLNDKFGYALRKDEVAETLDTLMLIGKIKMGERGLYQKA
jgi:hypothetical protein